MVVLPQQVILIIAVIDSFNTMTNDILQIGAVAVIFLFAIKEFFSYLKLRRNGSSGNQVMEAMLKELRIMNENHLHALKDAINTGNDRIVDTINSGNVKQIELLGEIRGNLNRNK